MLTIQALNPISKTKNSAIKQMFPLLAIVKSSAKQLKDQGKSSINVETKSRLRQNKGPTKLPPPTKTEQCVIQIRHKQDQCRKS